MDQKIKSNLVDLDQRSIYPVELTIQDEKITSIAKIEEVQNTFILPGFIDAHVHIESSMLLPSEFAKIAVSHGTVATVSDPHEIANVVGIEGVDFMIQNGQQVPFHFFFGAPSCVPATHFETAGAEISAADIDMLLARPEIIYLTEMMNFPGVIHDDPEVLKKISHAKKHCKPIDGHAPGLSGKDLQKYIAAGISTDHECFRIEEGREKLNLGMKVLIREGSAAKNFDELIPLLKEYPEMIMFCSDDKHPDDLLLGHIDQLVKRALNKGHDLFDTLRAASVNVIDHYNLPVGRLRIGDNADFIEVSDLSEFRIIKTYVSGKAVFENGKSLIKSISSSIINKFECSEKRVQDFMIVTENPHVRVIEALDGQLVTKELHTKVLTENGLALPDIEQDILKIAVVNRYTDAPVSLAFIKNFGLKVGAIASCVAHDCHNIVAVGTNDDDICNAVNFIIRNKGGISACFRNDNHVLPLPVAGIMSTEDAYTVAEKYTLLDKKAKEFGSTLKAPIMSLSFMALLVIPKLKLSDKGLFDGESFSFRDLFIS